MDHDLTYKTILNSIIPNKLFDDMACEACSTKFTLFKRKKQCKDCLRFYCTDCVIRRNDRVLSCDNCSMLSRRPLIRSQVLKMKSKDLKQYLIAKKVSLRGCVEKEDLIRILMIYANGADSQMNNETSESHSSQPSQPSAPRDIRVTREPRERPATLPDSPPRRSRSPPVVVREEIISSPDEEPAPQPPPRPHPTIDIVELSSDEDSPTDGPEPLVDEQETAQATEPAEATTTSPDNGSRESQSDGASPTCTEIPTWTGIVKLTDINTRSDLEYLNVKQLKDLLRTNRVDFRGCVERSELLDRASRLWDAHKQSREDFTASETTGEAPYEESLCKICWDSPIECVILECGHMACCLECGKQMNECPICRQYVVRVVRFFKA